MRENGHVTEVVSLMDGEWSCYGGGKFKEGRMVLIEVAHTGGGGVEIGRYFFLRGGLLRCNSVTATFLHIYPRDL